LFVAIADACPMVDAELLQPNTVIIFLQLNLWVYQSLFVASNILQRWRLIFGDHLIMYGERMTPES